MTLVQPAHILLVEDNPGDVVLTRRTLEQSSLPNHLHVVGDGESALAYVRQQAPFEDATRPDLVLLDINLPRMGGHDVLRQLKSDPETSMIPVVMLTSSSADADITRAYRQHANAYLTKGFGIEAFAAMIQQLEMFWFTVVRLPPKDAS